MWQAFDQASSFRSMILMHRKKLFKVLAGTKELQHETLLYQIQVQWGQTTKTF